MTKEVFIELFKDNRVLIEQIDSFGALSEPYNQDYDEWVYLLEGSAKLQIEGELIVLKKGDSTFIGKNRPHQVLWTSMDCQWLAVHLLESVQTRE